MKCYLCGKEAFKVIAGQEDIRFCCYGADKMVLECVFCGLVQLLPQWTEEESDSLYAQYSQKKDFEGQKRKVKISRWLPEMLNKEDRILEVGCGHGDNIQYLDEKGFNVVGIDKDLTICDDKLIFHCDWEKYIPTIKFDVIYGIHFLEHLSNPKEFIEWTIRNLSPKGKFIFEIPCIDDPLLTLYRSKAFNKFYWYPYHLFFYRKKTAELMFQEYWATMRNDVKVFQRQEYGLLNHLRWIFLRRPGNLNWHIPVLDDIYKFILTRLGYSDTLIIVGQNN